MIAVADTSPISYLILIGEVELLAALFKDIYIPPAVAAELSDARTPDAVREWSATAPSWLRIVDFDPETPDSGLQHLHRGEQEAILLAQHVKADMLLIDEKTARRAAIGLGLPVMGLLGVLEAASQEGRVDVVAAVDRLRHTNFRVSASLIRDLLEHHRRGSSGAE